MQGLGVQEYFSSMISAEIITTIRGERERERERIKESNPIYRLLEKVIYGIETIARCEIYARRQSAQRGLYRKTRGTPVNRYLTLRKTICLGPPVFFPFFPKRTVQLAMRWISSQRAHVSQR